jgi:hypothetical protein
LTALLKTAKVTKGATGLDETERKFKQALAEEETWFDDDDDDDDDDVSGITAIRSLSAFGPTFEC